MIVWELKRPHLEKLPEIPQRMLQGDLEAAKHFCIQNIEDALTTSPDNTQSVIAEIVKWMIEKLAPKDVIELHESISVDLPNQNGIVVTEYNDTLINTTGSAINCIFLGNTSRSKSALFYIAPYIGKNQVKVASALTSLNMQRQSTSQSIQV